MSLFRPFNFIQTINNDLKKLNKTIKKFHLNRVFKQTHVQGLTKINSSIIVQIIVSKI